jgi:hypothetical protein
VGLGRSRALAAHVRLTTRHEQRQRLGLRYRGVAVRAILCL